MAFVAQAQFTGFRIKMVNKMNESVNQFRGLLEAAQRSFAGMEQRMSLCDPFLDAKFRDTDEALTNAGKMMNAAQLRAEEAFSRVQILETKVE